MESVLFLFRNVYAVAIFFIFVLSGYGEVEFWGMGQPYLAVLKGRHLSVYEVPFKVKSKRWPCRWTLDIFEKVRPEDVLKIGIGNYWPQLIGPDHLLSLRLRKNKLFLDTFQAGEVYGMTPWRRIHQQEVQFKENLQNIWVDSADVMGLKNEQCILLYLTETGELKMDIYAPPLLEVQGSKWERLTGVTFPVKIRSGEEISLFHLEVETNLSCYIKTRTHDDKGVTYQIKLLKFKGHDSKFEVLKFPSRSRNKELSIVGDIFRRGSLEELMLTKEGDVFLLRNTQLENRKTYSPISKKKLAFGKIPISGGISSMAMGRLYGYSNSFDESYVRVEDDLEIAYIKRLNFDKTQMTKWPNRFEKLYFEIALRNNGIQTIERNQVRLELFENVERRDADTNLAFKPREIIVKRPIEPFDAQRKNYYTIYIEALWPYMNWDGVLNTKEKQAWLIVKARFERDRILRNNRKVCSYTAKPFMPTISKKLLNSFEPMSSDPNSLDYYFSKLCNAYCNMERRSDLDLEREWNYEGYELYTNQSPKTKKPWYGNTSASFQRKNQVWQGFHWKGAKGDLYEMALRQSPFVNFHQEVLPLSFMKRVGRPFYEVKHREENIFFNQVTKLPMLIQKWEATMIGKLARSKVKHWENKVADYVEFQLIDFYGKPIPKADLELWFVGDLHASFIGMTDNNGIWKLNRFKVRFRDKGMCLKYRINGYTSTALIQSPRYHSIRVLQEAYFDNPKLTRIKIKTLYSVNSKRKDWNVELMQRGNKGSFLISDLSSSHLDFYIKEPFSDQFKLKREYVVQQEKVEVPFLLDDRDEAIFAFISKSDSDRSEPYILNVPELKNVESMSLDENLNFLLTARDVYKNTLCRKYQEQNYIETLLDFSGSDIQPFKLVASIKRGVYYASLNQAFRKSMIAKIRDGDEPELVKVSKSLGEGQARDLITIQFEQKEYIVTIDEKQDKLVIFNENLDKKDHWMKDGFSPAALARDPRDSSSFFVLDRREKRKSWLYLFKFNGDAIFVKHVWLEFIPVGKGDLGIELGLDTVLSGGKLLAAITDASRQRVLEYHVENESISLLRKIDVFNKEKQRFIYPKEVLYRKVGGKVTLYVLDYHNMICKIK